jgi:lipopolysaccharide/colanic/teichoic acid biosynthesis glycosyltransferase
MSTKIEPLTVQSNLNRNWFSRAIKRMFDIVVSAIILLLIWPILGFIALAIRRDSPGPVFYRGKRVGLGGKTFNILKFRTMYEDPASYSGPRVTAHDDPRITHFGRWLRDTKVNELPQFWNVLKGEMSLVGPRPEDPSLAKTWPTAVRGEILSVRPGITSPASILYRNEEALLSYGGVLQKYIQEVGPDKIRLDQLYVHYRSFWLDLDVLLWTALIFIPRVGSIALPEDLLFVGLFNQYIRRIANWFTIDMLVTLMAIGLTGLIWRTFEPLNVGLLRASVVLPGPRPHLPTPTSCSRPG